MLHDATIELVHDTSLFKFSVEDQNTIHTNTIQVVSFNNNENFFKQCQTDFVLFPKTSTEQWSRLGSNLPTSAIPSTEPHLRHVLNLNTEMTAVNVNRLSISMFINIFHNVDKIQTGRPTLISWTAGDGVHEFTVYLVGPKYDRIGVHISGTDIDFTYEVNENDISIPKLIEEDEIEMEKRTTSVTSSGWHQLSVSISAGGSSFIMVDGISSTFDTPLFSIPRTGTFILSQDHRLTIPQNTFFGRMSRVIIVWI